MKAVVCRQFGPPELLELAEVPSPTPGHGEVVIAVAAASVNFPDLLTVQGKYQVKPSLPFVPGAEASGVITRVGEGVSAYAVGDRVMAYTRQGAFAEEVAVSTDYLMRTPASMAEPTAAAFLVTYGTAYHALADRAALQAGETVLVLGAAGGIGIAGIEVAKALGGRVIACASTPEKLAVCREHGADAVINYVSEDLRARIADLTSAHGVDVVYDPVGGPTTERALRSTGWRGRLLVIGFAAGDIPRIALNLPLLKGNAIVGVSWAELMRREPTAGARSFATLAAWYDAGQLRPHVSLTLPLEAVQQALALMAQRRTVGKVVLRIGGPA